MWGFTKRWNSLQCFYAYIKRISADAITVRGGQLDADTKYLFSIQGLSDWMTSRLQLTEQDRNTLDLRQRDGSRLLIPIQPTVVIYLGHLEERQHKTCQQNEGPWRLLPMTPETTIFEASHLISSESSYFRPG